MLASSQETRVVKTGMDEASSTSIISTRPKKRYRSLEERRQIVEEALVPGVSVAAIARAHGVNANLLFHWRQAVSGWTAFYTGGARRGSSTAGTSGERR